MQSRWNNCCIHLNSSPFLRDHILNISSSSHMVLWNLSFHSETGFLLSGWKYGITFLFWRVSIRWRSDYKLVCKIIFNIVIVIRAFFYSLDHDNKLVTGFQALIFLAMSWAYLISNKTILGKFKLKYPLKTFP